MAALLVTGGVAVAAGSAFADSGSDSGSGSGSGVLSALTGSDESDSGGSDSASGEDKSGNDGSGSDESDRSGRNGDSRNGGGRNGDSRNGDGENVDGRDRGGRDHQRQRGQGSDRNQGDQNNGGNGNGNGNGGQAANADPLGRDQIAPAGRNDYVDINDVAPNGNIGDGGQFNRGSYSVDCGVSDHNNSDNYMAAPGKKNGAQHVHDYVGNNSTNADSNDNSLEQAGTSCVNEDKSTFFWPVLRDLNGSGPDVGEDGGSLDGNVGAILKPRSAQLTFHGHGDQKITPMPTHLMMIMGNAKQGQQNGDNVNAKYTCSNTPDRVTDKYPICGQGGQLQRLLDYPSCWDGQNLESANFRDHMAFPDSSGNCSDGFKPIPALRITLTYDQPAGRAFSIDSFPQEQHDPKTDHSDFENLASQDSNDAGAACINEGRTCANLPQ